jgi:SlyX protein
VTDAGRLDTLEFKVAHLERAQQELSDVLVRQQQDLQRLQERLARLQQLLETLQQPAEPQDPFEIPPHY